MRNLGHHASVFSAALLLAACGSSKPGGSATQGGSGTQGGAATQGGGPQVGGRAGSAANGGGGSTNGAGESSAGRGGVASTGGADNPGDAGSSGNETGGDTGDGPLPPDLEWTLVAETAGQTWEGIWGSGPNDVYVVGRLGDLIHFSAGKWASEVTDTNSTLTGVWGSGPNDVYVSVYSNLILHSTGDGVWAHETLNAGLTFEQVWGLDADTVFALGRGVYRRNGAADWSLEAGSYGGADLWGSAITNRYVVGPAGGATTVAHSTGATQWSGQPGPEKSLYAVFGTSANAVFVGGVSGVFFSTGDGTWQPQLALDPTAGNPINAIWAAGPDAVFACSELGFVYRSNGAGRWSEGKPINGAGPVRNCNAIWGAAADDVYLATVNGVFHGSLP